MFRCMDLADTVDWIVNIMRMLMVKIENWNGVGVMNFNWKAYVNMEMGDVIILLGKQIDKVTYTWVLDNGWRDGDFKDI